MFGSQCVEFLQVNLRFEGLEIVFLCFFSSFNWPSNSKVEAMGGGAFFVGRDER